MFLEEHEFHGDEFDHGVSESNELLGEHDPLYSNGFEYDTFAENGSWEEGVEDYEY